MEPKHLPPSPPPADAEADVFDVRRRRIVFRATHRGTHETDILIGGFVARFLAGFSEQELDSLEEVMELPDVDLADWLTGRRPIPADRDSPMLRRIEQAAWHAASQARADRLARDEGHHD